MRYLPPGQPVPPLPAPSANSYLAPAAVVQQTTALSSAADPVSATSRAGPRQEPHRGPLFDEWRRHGSDLGAG